MDLEEHFLENVRAEFARTKRLAEKAMAQLPDAEAWHRTPDEESNSIAVLVQHLGGNMVSRWTDFLTSDGEKPDRHRDREFESNESATPDELMKIWERGWACALGALEELTPADLTKTVHIRGEPHTVMEAIHRQYGHASYHVGQIVLEAKHLAAGSWETLSIPRGGSKDFGGGYKQR